MDDDGNIDEIKFVQREPTVVRTCVSLTGSDVCDKAYNVFKCVMLK